MPVIKYKHLRGKTEIEIGRDFLHENKTWRFVAKKHLIFVYDKAVASQATKLISVLKANSARLSVFPAEAGEQSKDWNQIPAILSFLQKENTTRDSILIVMGGGSLGDTFGFVASIYQRGISWCVIPTTLLAQVDSSIGGKTGLNLSSGKNLVGSFHQPLKIFIETGFLAQLPEREVISGFGEILKYAITQDKRLFEGLEVFFESKRKLSDLDWIPIIKRCAKIKAQTVERDEFDQTGIREVLNFGHTFGHALETATNYRTFRHGEAVIWGMKFATHLSGVKKMMKRSEAERALRLLDCVEIPALPSNFDATEIKKLMNKDKKNREFLRFVLVKKPGRATTGNKATDAELDEALSSLLRPSPRM